MSDTPPGWYRDDDDHQLARWWDGVAWTTDTVVIGYVPPGTPAPTRFPRLPSTVVAVTPSSTAIPPEEGSIPGPAGPWDHRRPARGSETGLTIDLAALPIAPERLPDSDPYVEEWEDDSDRPPALVDRIRDWPAWTRVVAPIALVALMVLAVAAASSISTRSRNDTVDTSTSTTTVAPATTQITLVPPVTATSVLDTTTSSVEPVTPTTARPRTTTTVRAPSSTAPPTTSAPTTIPAPTTTAAPTVTEPPPVTVPASSDTMCSPPPYPSTC